MKIWILLVLVVFFSIFSVYTYRVRTAFNVEKQIKHNDEHHYQLEVVEYALAVILPDKKNSKVFFKHVENSYPNFKEDESLCRILRYEKTEEEIKQEEEKEKEETKNKDTAALKVMDYIVSPFGHTSPIGITSEEE